ncbi:uncharacterized protein [Miscanthus floridulus]|uniref:uncharacterized protein n=1 Tax=Miscanthus floridulus TaxID=154761 RepID=UPI003458876B
MKVPASRFNKNRACLEVSALCWVADLALVRRNFLSVEFIYFRTRFSYETECRQRFRVHEMECLNCPSSLGIQHLSSFNKVGIIIWSDWPGYDGNNYPVEDDHDDPVRCISRAINAAIETLPNRPAFRFERAQDKCIHFEPDETHDMEEEEKTDKEEETSEKEVAQQDDSGSSN